MPKILLVQNSPYFPSFAGGNKSDRLLLGALARKGHECRVVARIDDNSPAGEEAYRGALLERNVSHSVEAGVVRFDLDGVEILVATVSSVRALALREVRDFAPDVVLVSTDPLNVLVLDLAQIEGLSLIYISRSPMLLPFGPESAHPSRVKTEAIRKTKAVVAVSRYLADYIATYAGLPAQNLAIQLMDPLEWTPLGSFDNPFITMVNPCGLKGISIFLGLADACPDLPFAAVPTWGTTPEDLAELKARPNIGVLDPLDDIRELLKQTRVTLIPSLWAEARSRLIFESMACGVPVLASDRGGNREALMGVPGLLPVAPIVGYEDRFDSRTIRIPKCPPQDLDPWKNALTRLVTDRSYYEEISRQSRAAALDHARMTGIESFDSLIREIAGCNAT